MNVPSHGGGARRRSREQLRAGLGELHVGAAFVQPQSAARDGKIEARLVFGRAALVLK
jgi:hypothetical protein